MLHFFYTVCHFWNILLLFGILYAHLCTFFLKILRTLAFCVQYIPILLVAVSQCDKQKNHLLQGLSATNKTNLCHSDSVRQTILKKHIQFICRM